MISYCIFFFFKLKTAYDLRISDWSSDVCSSDLLARHLFDLAAHTVECLVNPLALGLDIFGHDLIDCDARLMIDRVPHRQALDQGEARNGLHADPPFTQRSGIVLVDQSGVGDQLAEHHGRRLQRLDLRSEEHTSELQSLMRNSYAVFCL